MTDVLIVRDGVHEAVAKYLDAKGIGVISRVQQSDFDTIARITSVPTFHRVTDVDEDDQAGVACTIKPIRIGDLDYVSVEAEEATLLR